MGVVFVVLTKEQLRRSIRSQRKELSLAGLKSKSTHIQNKLFALPEFKKSTSILFYVSIGKEVVTKKMIEDVLRAKEKTVLVPKIFGENLAPCKIASVDELHKGMFNIPEPLTENFFTPSKIGMVIVPALAFTEQGDRLGYGRGYFDRFLKKTNAIKVGVCLEEFIVPSLPVTASDVAVDIVVTEKRVIHVSKKQNEQRVYC